MAAAQSSPYAAAYLDTMQKTADPETFKKFMDISAAMFTLDNGINELRAEYAKAESPEKKKDIAAQATLLLQRKEVLRQGGSQIMANWHQTAGGQRANTLGLQAQAAGLRPQAAGFAGVSALHVDPARNVPRDDMWNEPLEDIIHPDGTIERPLPTRTSSAVPGGSGFLPPSAADAAIVTDTAVEADSVNVDAAGAQVSPVNVEQGQGANAPQPVQVTKPGQDQAAPPTVAPAAPEGGEAPATMGDLISAIEDLKNQGVSDALIIETAIRNEFEGLTTLLGESATPENVEEAAGELTVTHVVTVDGSVEVPLNESAKQRIEGAETLIGELNKLIKQVAAGKVSAALASNIVAKAAIGKNVVA
jgi:hypothetical protein